MKLGFVSAILPDLSLEEVVKFAAREGYDCVELMCWPKGKAERRYAGVTHLDLDRFAAADAKRVNALMEASGIQISGLGYYPNPLAPDPAEAKLYADHIKKVIRASALLGVNQMNTFIGRDPAKTIDANWPHVRSADVEKAITCLGSRLAMDFTMVVGVYLLFGRPDGHLLLYQPLRLSSTAAAGLHWCGQLCRIGR